MNEATIKELLNEDKLAALFPEERADQFFDALFGDAAEGSYDIKLSFSKYDPAAHTLRLGLELHERPGKCLACNLTHGLPEVFSRHPIINIKEVVAAIDQLLGDQATCKEWRLGATHTHSKGLHVIPLIITLG